MLCSAKLRGKPLPMTDAECALMNGLVTAGWPLAWQIAFGVALLAGYFAWSRIYFRAVDPGLRAWLGRRLGARVVWVQRHGAEYPTPFELTRAQYRRWSWGIEPEAQRTFGRDGAAAVLCILCVNVLGGLWIPAAFLFVFLGLKAISYVVFLPACVGVIGIYSAFWSGKHEVDGMR